MLIKVILILLLLFIVYQLFRAMILMLKAQPGDRKMSTHLGRRVALSVLVVLIIIVAMALGWIQPHRRPY